ncbi:MAG: oppB [Chlamydiales bacterium]|jgi:oligopeptide transport system permease protein|nr:oppB [Chlamydiales bacterium]
MLIYVIQKITSLVITLFVIITLTFFIMKAIPGDPFSQEQNMPVEIKQALNEHYGLNDPLLIQYGKYLISIAQGDLGPSFKYKGRNVNEIIQEGLPVSAQLGFQALIIAMIVGVTLGTIAGLHQHQWQDYTIMTLAVLGISIPGFLLATFLQYFIAIKGALLPVALWKGFSYTILPSLALAALPIAFITRLTRSSVIDVLQQEYVKTARAKGLSHKLIISRHILKNALLPVITYLGPLSANILTGSFVVEKIFGIPGLGQWMVISVSNRDYTVIMGIAIFYSTLLLSAIFVVDLIYRWLDPRMGLYQQNTISNK